MLTGFPTTCFPGEHHDAWLLFTAKADNTGLGAIITGIIAPGYGDMWWRIGADGIPQQIVKVPETSAPQTWSVTLDPSRSTHSVFAAPLGDWDSDIDIDVTIQTQDFQDAVGSGLGITFPAVMSIEQAYGDADQLTGWTIAGITRFATATLRTRPTEAKVGLTLLTVAGTHTVTLYAGTDAIASGSIIGDGVVTLAAVNGSGVTGSVTLAYTADIDSAADAYVLARWCSSYVVALTGAEAQTKTVLDSGRGDALTVTFPNLDAGTYAVSVTPISDTGKAGTPITQTGVVVPGRPEPITGLALQSTPGNWAGTKIQFTASATSGATYNVYDSALNEPTDLWTVVATHAAGTGVLTLTLPSLPAAAAGIRRVVVQAVNGGVPDGAFTVLSIEYAADGSIVLPRPNAPSFTIDAAYPVANGRTIKIDYVYDTANQAAPVKQLKIWLVAEADEATFDPAVVAPTATQTVAATPDSLITGSLNVTALADGYFKALVRAATLAGTVSNNTALSDEVFVSNVLPPAPGSMTVEVIV